RAWQLPAGSGGAPLLGQARFPWSTVRDAVLASAQAQSDKLVAEHGGGFHVELVQGPPAQAITDTAERGSHDLIVVGAHGNRGFRRLLLASVAESTVRHAHCSVLVVHGPRHRAPPPPCPRGRTPQPPHPPPPSGRSPAATRRPFPASAPRSCSLPSRRRRRRAAASSAR